MKIIVFALIFIGLVSLSASCNKDKDVDFDRSVMLENYADNLILVDLRIFQDDLNELELAAETFVNTPNTVNLTALKASHLNTYLALQKIKPYAFGPLETSTFSQTSNIYPVDTNLIENNITSGTYNLSEASNLQGIGFPAIDYLIFSQNEAATIDLFTSDDQAENRKALIVDIIAKLKLDFSAALSDWTSTYASTFKSNTGVDVGSSTGLLYNAFIKDAELLKNAKIGIPGGQQTGGMTFPSYVEGYYAENSKELAIKSCEALKKIFNGNEGSGIDDYLRHVEGDEVETSMADIVNDQFDLCLTKLNGLGSPLSSEVEENFSGVNSTYQEIKKLITYLKTDVASLLGILITFQDNDGD